MIHVRCEQGSPEWFQARVGVVTASHANDVLTPKTRKPAKGEAYLDHLLAELLMGEPADQTDDDAFRRRGSDMEAMARGWYAFEHEDEEIEEVGFLLRDDRRLGCSPDFLVGLDGGGEIKIPSAANHTGNLRDPEGFVVEHFGQVQIGLLVTGREWWDLVSWHPTLPPLARRILPDAEYLEAFGPALASFLERLDAARAALQPLVDAAFDPIASATMPVAVDEYPNP